MKINLAVAELPRVRGSTKTGGVQPYHRGLDPDREAARGPRCRPGVGAGRHPRRARAHGAVRPDGARSVARAGGRSTSSRSASDRSRTRSRDATWDDIKRRRGRPGDRASRRRSFPNLPGLDPASGGADAARSGATAGAHRRAPPARRHVARSAAVPAARARLRRLPNARRPAVPLRRRHASGRRRHRRERTELCTRGARTTSKREGLMLDRFDELADGLNHPEGVAWNPFDGLVYAGGEGGELYAVTLDGDVELRGSTGGSMLGHRRRRGGSRLRVRRRARARSRGWTRRRGRWTVYARGVDGDDLDTPERRRVRSRRRRSTSRARARTTGPRSCGSRRGGGGRERWTTAVPSVSERVSRDAGRIGASSSSRPRPSASCACRSSRTVRPGAPETSPTLPDTDADGISLAADGSYWVTLYRPDGLVRIAPDGAVATVVDDHLASHLDAPTNIAWVGEALDRAVVANVGGTVPVDRGRRRGRPPAPLPGGAVMARFTDRNVDRDRRRPGDRPRASSRRSWPRARRCSPPTSSPTGLERMRASRPTGPRRDAPVDLVRLRRGEGDGARGDRAARPGPRAGELRRHDAGRSAHRRRPARRST